MTEMVLILPNTLNMMFGYQNLFWSLAHIENYDKNEKRIVGGKNGFGFKLALIWSTYGKIETIDHTRG